MAIDLPSDRVLLATLRTFDPGSGLPAPIVSITERRRNTYTSSSPAEVITCRLSSGTEMCLLAKYGKAGRTDADGHWGDTRYEARIYAEILCPLSLTRPEFIGASERGSGCWLFLQYLEDARRLNKTDDPIRAAEDAAVWIGRFHALHATRLDSTPGIRRHDACYYADRADRALRFAEAAGKGSAWLRKLCRCFVDQMPWLLSGEQTVIHGEFYPANILISDGTVYPVDWESAAIGMGELDLVSLAEGWSEEVVDCLERAYARGRWDGRAPEDFSRRLELVRLFSALRWLGAGPEWAADPESAPYYDQLQAAGRRLGAL